MNQGRQLIEEIQQTQPGDDGLAFWWLGQHSFVVKIGQHVLYMDPYLSPSPARLIPPLLCPADVTNASVVFGSHLHGDHIDLPAFVGIAAASPGARFVVPRVARPILQSKGIAGDRIVAVDADWEVPVGPLMITGVAAAHEFFDNTPETGHPYLGFVVQAGPITFYHSGDTCKYEGLEALLKEWSLDVAFLPINGRDAERLRANCIGNMTYQEAADLAGAIQPRLTVPGHYGMFAGNTVDPALFRDYMAVKYPQLRVVIPEPGVRVLL